MSLQSNIAVSVVRSVESDRLQPVNSRVTGLEQDQLAAQAVFETTKKKVRASDKAEKSNIKKDRDSEEGTSGEHGAYQGQSYSADGQTETVGDEPEGHIFDALA